MPSTSAGIFLRLFLGRRGRRRGLKLKVVLLIGVGDMGSGASSPDGSMNNVRIRVLVVLGCDM